MAEGDYEGLEDVAYAKHRTFLRSSEEFVLKRCEDDACGCGKIHCPFCDVSHYKPTQQARVRDHLNVMHFMHAVHYEGMMIVKCYFDCMPSVAAGHYHCPHCSRQIGKRTLFTRHLQMHFEKMGKDVNLVQSPDFKQPGKIMFDGYEIPLCVKVCEDALGKHYHCPLCTVKNFSELGPMMAHLWRCREDGKQDSSGGKQRRTPRKSLSSQKEAKAVKPKPHMSVLKTVNDLPVERCNVDKCCNKKYHCPLCNTNKYKPGTVRQLNEHLKIHWKNRVEIKDYIVVNCNRDCEKVKGSSRVCSHYHCPVCVETFRRKETFETHVRRCKVSSTEVKTPKSTPKTKAKAPEVAETPEKDEVENEEDEIKGTRKPTSGTGNKQKKAAAMVTMSDSSDENEAFDKVTAVISKKIILSLTATSSVETVLEEVARDTGITWNWSPGTMEPVYTMTGDLVALLKAKGLLKKFKEEHDKRIKVAIQTAPMKTDKKQKEYNEIEEMPPLEFDDGTTDPEQLPVNTTTEVPKEPPSLVEENVQNNLISDQGADLKRSISVEHVELSTAPNTMITVDQVELSTAADTMVTEGMTVSIADMAAGTTSEFQSITGNVITADDMLEKPIDIIVAAATQVGDLQEPPMTIVEAVAPTTSMVQTFADTLIEAASAELAQMSEPTLTGNSSTVAVDDLQSTGPLVSVTSSMDAITTSSMEQMTQTPIFQDEQPSSDEKMDTTEACEAMDESALPDDVEKSGAVVKVGGEKRGLKRDREEHSYISDPVPDELETPLTIDQDQDQENHDKEFKEAASPRKRCRKTKVPPTPTRQYSTRGVKMNFSLLHSGKTANVDDDDDDDDDDDKLVSPPKRKYRRRTYKQESSDEESESSEEYPDDSDQDPDFKVDGSSDHDYEEEKSRRSSVKTEKSDSSSFHIASIPVVRFASQSSSGEQSGQVSPRKHSPRVKRGRGRPPKNRQVGGRRRRKMKDELGKDDIVSKICLECAFVADSFSNLTDHLVEVHGIEEPARCDICEKKFNKNRDKVHHLIMKHGPFNLVDGQIHQNHDEENINRCTQCDLEADSFSGLSDHLIADHSVFTLLRCDVCEKTFKKLREKTFHLAKQHFPLNKKIQFTCDLCGHICKSRRSLNWHRSYAHNISSKKNPNVCYCPKCDFETQNPEELKAHKKDHLEDRQYCNLCQKTFAKTTDLKTHIQAVHMKNKSCTCEVCGKIFNHWRYLTAHMERHTGEKKHLCNICGCRFGKAAILREHLETHKVMSERNYKFICSFCDARYYSRDKYLDHMNKHTGEKPHVCDECGKGFGFRSMLQKHKIYVHTTDRPFKCECCDKAFKFKQILKNHMVIHTGESKYVCDGCKRPFSCSATLKGHRPKCRGDNSWQKRKSGGAKTQTQTVSLPVATLPRQEIQVAVTQPSLPQLVDTIVVEMGDGQRSVVDLNSLEAAAQMAEADNSAATGIYLCSVCNAMFDSVNSAEEHIAAAHGPGKPPEEDVTERLQLHVEEVLDQETDANITSLISELETKVKSKLEPISVMIKTD